MFRRKANVTIVTTKEQLKSAVSKKEPYIEIRGELAKKMRWIGKIPKSKVALLATALGSAAVAGSATAVTPVVSFAAVPMAAVATITGKEIAAIIMSSGIALSLFAAVLKGYEVDAQYDGISLCLKRK